MHAAQSKQNHLRTVAPKCIFECLYQASHSISFFFFGYSRAKKILIQLLCDISDSTFCGLHDVSWWTEEVSVSFFSFLIWLLPLFTTDKRRKK